MPEYRVYIVKLDGHAELTLEFICSDDDRARERLRAMNPSVERAELWQGRRFVDLIDKRRI